MRLLGTALLLLGCAQVAAAQRQTGTGACRGLRIDSITVSAEAPTVTGLRRVPVIGNLVRETHVVTREDVIRRFLLLHVGGRCTELRRTESERILRAQPFIADATIDVTLNALGGVNSNVLTDEAVLSARYEIDIADQLHRVSARLKPE